MRAPLLLALLLATAATIMTHAFVPPAPTTPLRRSSSSPRSSLSHRVTTTKPAPVRLALSPLDVADALIAAAETDYEYGAVAAPGAWTWVYVWSGSVWAAADVNGERVGTGDLSVRREPGSIGDVKSTDPNHPILPHAHIPQAGCCLSGRS